MQFAENGPSHMGDSDDEIAELRIEALLTKRENEAEVSKPLHEHPYSQPVHQSHLNPRSGYQQYGNSYSNRRPHRGFFGSFRHHNPYHPSFAGKTVNSSNIVVLTSSENDPPPQWQPRPKAPYRPQPYRPPVQSAAIAAPISSASKLILPQDKYSKPPAHIMSNSDNKTKQMSARMKRLQGSDSDSDDSDTDSSSDSSSSSSSSSDTSSSSDSSSNDSDSEVDAKAKKEKKLDRGKVNERTAMNMVGETKSKPLAPGHTNSKLSQNEALSYLKGKSDQVKAKQNENKTTAKKNEMPHRNEKFRSSRSRSPGRRFKSKSPMLKSRPKKLPSRSPRANPLSPRMHSGSPRFSSRMPRLRSRTPPPRLRSRTPPPRLRSRTPPRFRSRTPPQFRSRTPPRFRSRTPLRLRSKSPRFRSRSPALHLKSPKRSSRSPRLRPLSPRFRSGSPKPRSKSPYKQIKSPWQRKVASGLRSFSPSPRTYRRSLSPYRQPLTKGAQRIGSRSPHFRPRLSRSPISPKAGRKAPFRLRSRSPFTREGIPFARQRSPLQRLRSPSPFTRRHSPSLYSRSPPMPKNFSPAKQGFSRGMPHGLHPQSRRPYSPIRLISPHNLDEKKNSYLRKESAGYLNEGRQFSHGIPNMRSQSPSAGSRIKVVGASSQSPPSRREYYEETYEYSEYRQNQSQNRFPSNADREQQLDSSRELYQGNNRLRRSISPWNRDVPQRHNFAPGNFEPHAGHLRNVRGARRMLPEQENQILPIPNITDVHDRLQYRGRGRLLGNQRGGQSRGNMNMPSADRRGGRFGFGDDIPSREQSTAFENVHPSDQVIRPLIDPSVSYKNRAGERHIPYSLFEDELKKKSANQSKNEHAVGPNLLQLNTEHFDDKRQGRDSSNWLKNRPIRSHVKDSFASRKQHLSIESKNIVSRTSDVRNESKMSKSKQTTDRLRNSKDSIKSRKSNEDDKAHATKRIRKNEIDRHEKAPDDAKRRSTDRNKADKVDMPEKSESKERPRVKETSQKAKVPKGPRTPSYSPEIETQVDPVQLNKGDDTTDVDLAALAAQRAELEEKLREEESLLKIVAKDEEERMKNAKVKEEKVMAERAKGEKLVLDSSEGEKLMIGNDMKDGIKLSRTEGTSMDPPVIKTETEDANHRSQRDESYQNYNMKSNLRDDSFALKDKRSDSKYNLQSDFFNISDVEFSRTLSLEEVGDSGKKKKKQHKKEKDKSKKRSTKEKKEDKHRKHRKEKKKKKDAKKKQKKEKKEHQEKHRKDKEHSTMDKKQEKSKPTKKICKTKPEAGDKTSHRSTRDSLPLLQVNRSRHVSDSGKGHKRKRDDSRESTRVEKKNKVDHKVERRGNRYDKEETDKAILVTVREGSGADRLVTSGRQPYKAKYEPPRDSNSSKLPVHMRLGRSVGKNKAEERKRSAIPRRKNSDRRRGR